MPIMKQAIRGGLFVVIPAYLELETLPHTLESLLRVNKSNAINIVIVVNCGAEDSDHMRNESTKLFGLCNDFAKKHNSESIQILPIQAFDFPPKVKGAGAARKLGMDQVVAYCNQYSVDDALVASLDADSLVATNYISEIEAFFKNKKRNACSIFYEHPVTGEEYGAAIYDGIVQYELHLRYYIQCLKAAGFPYAFHTVGSSMAFRMSAYAKAGGMTRKQAGEDFYMIHKLVLQGGYGELNSTTVYPSPRPSSRVVFGTGATIQEWIDSNSSDYFTYNLQAFIDLKQLFDQVACLYGISESEYEKIIVKLSGRVRSFLVETNFWQEMVHINENSSTVEAFNKRFFEQFNAFKIIKYLNFVHEHFLEKTEITDVAAQLLLLNNKIEEDAFLMSSDLLIAYREIDKSGEALQLG